MMRGTGVGMVGLGLVLGGLAAGVIQIFGLLEPGPDGPRIPAGRFRTAPPTRELTRGGEGLPVWRFDLGAATRLPSADGDTTVDVVALAWLDGGAVVARGGRRWLRHIIGPDGAILARYRQGNGPDELPTEGDGDASAEGDTVLFVDGLTNTVRQLRPPAYHLPTEALPLPVSTAAAAIWFGPRLPDGRRFALVRQTFPDPALPAERWRVELQWQRLTADQRTESILARWPETETADQRALVAWDGFTLLVGSRTEPAIDRVDTLGRVLERWRLAGDGPVGDQLRVFGGLVWLERVTRGVRTFDLIDPIAGRAVGSAWLPERYTLDFLRGEWAILFDRDAGHSLLVPVRR